MKIRIIGLGYRGLPLPIEFGRKREVIDYNTNQRIIYELKS